MEAIEQKQEEPKEAWFCIYSIDLDNKVENVDAVQNEFFGTSFWNK